MVDLTVAMPVFKGKSIFWLAMESLCRQKDVNCTWELVVAEEQIEPFAGESAFYKYFSRLQEVGCKDIKYIPLKEWVPLSQKWRLLGKHADSEMFVCQADDNYAHPYRLKEAYENINYDYICYPHCLFYYIANHMAYHHTIKPYKRSTKPAKGLHYSFKTEFAKKIPKSDRSIIVDQWLYDFFIKYSKNAMSHKWVLSPHWKEGFNSHGFHRLSKSRFEKHKSKAENADKYSKKWPVEIVQRLQSLSKEATL